MPQVSFERDIRPLFRAIDISHMARHGINLDDYTFMSDPDNADSVLGVLYAVPRHVRNIDIAKQWTDITRERNLGHTFSFLSPEGEPRIRNV